MSLLVTNIQRMCFDDGPGLRTTVFMKGCSIRCPWCSNPENLSFEPEPYEKNGTQATYGKSYSAKDLTEILLKDRKFWETDGGVTFSGGEALMQAKGLVDVWENLRKEQIHTAVETALFVPEDNLQLALFYVDYFIVDVKILEPAVCRSVLGGDITLYKKNVSALYQSGKLGLFRIPCCPEYTCTKRNLILLREFLIQYPDIPVQLFAIHDLGSGKYESLHRLMWRTQGMEEQLLEQYCARLHAEGISAEIIHL